VQETFTGHGVIKPRIQVLVHPTRAFDGKELLEA
jgi:hypothetical protein